MSIDIQQMSYTGLQVGIGLTLLPAAFTSLVACSRIIFVNIIANIAIRILTANKFRIEVYGISFVSVPRLWKISLISAIIGGALICLSLLAALTESIYTRYFLMRDKKER